MQSEASPNLPSRTTVSTVHAMLNLEGDYDWQPVRWSPACMVLCHIIHIPGSRLRRQALSGLFISNC